MPPYAPLLRWTGRRSRLCAQPRATSPLLLDDPFYLDAYLRVAARRAVSALLCLLLGYPMALAIARAPERRRNLLLLLVMLPFWTGFLLRVYAWIGLLRDEGWINGAAAARSG